MEFLKSGREMRLYISGILFSILCFSISLKNTEYRFVSESIKVSAQRVSPAFAVLEDSFLMEDATPSQKIFLDEIYIKSGEQKIVHMNLEGLTVKRSQSLKIAAQVSKITTQTKNLMKRIQLSKTHEGFRNYGSSSPHWNKTIKVPIKNFIRDEKATLSSFAESSKKSHLLALGSKNLNMKRHKEIQVDGASFLVGSPLSALNSINLLDWTPQFSGQRRGSLKDRENVEFKKPYSLTGSISEALVPTSNRATNILGRIRLADGAVLPGEEFSFYIQRTFDGMTQERGKIKSLTGEFGITVGELRGKLSVELRHDSGVVIAFGEYRLAQVNLQSIQDIIIDVRPAVDDAFVGRVISYESFEGNEISIKGKSELFVDGDSQDMRTNEKGYFLDAQIAAGSQILVSASHKGFWNSLQIAETGQPIQPILHSDKHMQAFLQLLEPYLERKKIHSVIWGRVSHKGRSVSKAKVHLLGEDIRPWYFDLRIPNPSLEETSEDGFFAFVNPTEGLHIIKAQVKGLDIPLETTVVRGGHTSVVGLETAPKKSVQLYSYEAFNSDKRVLSEVSTPGVGPSWKVGHKTPSSIPFYDRPTAMVINVDPLDSKYLPTRFFVGRRRSVMRIPNISRDWLDGLLAYQRVNITPRTGIIIGFIDQGKHSVDLGPLESQVRLIYFDSRGKVVKSLTQGGGFILANAPLGVISTNIKNLETGKNLKRLFFVEPHRVNMTQVVSIH